MIDEEKVKWPSKKQYPCKKLKGEHDFELKIVSMPTKYYVCGFIEPFFSTGSYEYKCSACGKKNITFKPLKVKNKTKDYKEI